MVSKPASHPDASAQGKEACFAELYSAHFQFVWRLTRRFGGRQRDLEDLVHDVFVAVHGALDRYDPTRPMRPWLFGITFRVVSDYRRRARFDREVPVDEHRSASTEPVALEHLVVQERRALVAQGLERLSMDQRAVFVMHEMEGESIPEIARVLGIPDNTCYSRLRLARARFTAAVRMLAARGSTNITHLTG